MYELLTRLVGHIYGIWRYRWYALALAWFVSLAGWTYVYSMPDEYVASARVFVDTESALRPLLRGLAIPTNVMGQVNLMTRALLSRPHLEKVARQTDLDLRAKTPQEMEDLINSMRRNLRISGAGKENLFSISFRDRDRETARAIVQSLLDSFVEDTLGANRTGSDSAQKFLDVQIENYEQRINDAERRLADFKIANVGQMPNDGQDYYSRLQNAIDSLNRTEAELTIGEDRVNELRSQIAGEVPMFGIESSQQRAQAHKLDEKIRDYENRIDQLSLQYTDRHPDIIAMRATLEDMRAKRENDLAEAASVSAPRAFGNVDRNPVYQSMKIALSQAEVELRESRVRREQQRAQVEKLRRLVDTIPEIEAELKRLNRDYEVNRGQYQELLQRRELAHMSNQASEMADDVQFRVIEPPVVPIEPSGPNRLLYFAAVFLVSMASGAGLAFLMYQLRPVYFSSGAIREALGLTVLGTVSRVWTGQQKRTVRIKTISFAVVLVSMFVAFAGVVVFEDAGVRLVGSMVQKVRS